MTDRTIHWLAVGMAMAIAATAAAGAKEKPVSPSPRADGYQVAVYYFPNWHRRAAGPGGKEVFGEWDRLAAARQRFDGHVQPKTPLWGAQDETDPAVMAQKIDAAADHGVDAFLFDWYYNDHGTFLERPLNEGYLKAPNHRRVKFALMWANHNLRGGKGAVGRATFDKLVAHVVADYLTHPAYWKVGGRPYFSIYQIHTFVEGLGGVDGAAKAIEHFRAQARKAGLQGVHINVVDFQIKNRPDAAALLKRLGADSVTSYVWVHIVRLKNFPQTDFGHVQRRYLDYWQRIGDRYGVPFYPNATMGWDSTPRIAPGQPHDGRGYPNTAIIAGNTPARFKQALAAIKARLAKAPADQRIVTINAWNEWTEGSYLEPDTVHKMAYLEAIRDVFGR